MNTNVSHYIGGEWIVGTGQQFSAINPSDGQLIWQGHAATEMEVQQAYRAARTAFFGWSQISFSERVAICEKFAELLKQHAEELAYTISQEVGKPLWEALGEVTSMINKVAISVQAYQQRSGEVVHKVADGHAVLRHHPHGVFAVLGPYNFPGHLPNGHIVPALMAGNTIIFKPSEYAPQTALQTMQLWIKAGVPKGVLNLVNGGQHVGSILSKNPELDGLLFTGSYPTGKLLHQHFAGQPEKVLALEMGGNNPLLVWNVSQVDAAVYHTISSAFISAGQRCTCARRLIIPAAQQGDRFLERLIDVASKIRIDQPNAKPAPFMGPVVSSAVARKLLAAQAQLIEQGGKSLLTMRHLKENTGFISPAIIDVTGVNDLPDTEWFGPLLQVIRVADFASAVQAANATRYGLAAALLSDDAKLWHQFQSSIRAGVVNWNRPTIGAASSAPFGGIKHSGNHRPGAYYAADYCAYPVASMEADMVEMPEQPTPGLIF